MSLIQCLTVAFMWGRWLHLSGMHATSCARRPSTQRPAVDVVSVAVAHLGISQPNYCSRVWCHGVARSSPGRILLNATFYPDDNDNNEDSANSAHGIRVRGQFQCAIESLNCAPSPVSPRQVFVTAVSAVGLQAKLAAVTSSKPARIMQSYLADEAIFHTSASAVTSKTVTVAYKPRQNDFETPTDFDVRVSFSASLVCTAAPLKSQ